MGCRSRCRGGHHRRSRGLHRNHVHSTDIHILAAPAPAATTAASPTTRAIGLSEIGWHLGLLRSDPRPRWDTLVVEGGIRIRLVLVDAPELSEPGGPEARDYLADLCFGSIALIDEDDGQIGDDPFGRVLAVVYCEGTNANAALISSGHANTFYDFCSVSEFGTQAWTGCSSAPPPPPPPPQQDCDPAYPTVCIPSPPPDLDCGDIPYTNFEVLPPDPHNFDGDEDGIGCES